MSNTPQPAANSYTEKVEGTYTAVLIVEGTKLYVIYELLAKYSEVFKKMFSGPWKESESKEVILPGKSLQAVVWLLDYMYPQTQFGLTGMVDVSEAMCQQTSFVAHSLCMNACDFLDASSTALLPLAVEYQMKHLLELCTLHFRRVYKKESSKQRDPDRYQSLPAYGKKDEDINEQHIPTLEMLTLAEKYDLNDLVDAMLVKCAAKLSLSRIDRQKKLPENKDLSDCNYLKLIRLRLQMSDQENHHKGFDYSSYTRQKKIRWNNFIDDTICKDMEIVLKHNNLG